MTRFRLVSLVFAPSWYLSSLTNAFVHCVQESHDLHFKQQGVEETGSSMRDLSSREDEIFTPNAGCEDDEFDPAMKEMLDR